MVCLPEEGIITKIRDTIGTSSMKQSVIRLTSTKTVESIFTEVGNDFSYAPDGIELLLKNGEGNLVIVLNEYRDKTLEEIGVGCTLDVLNTIEIVKLKQKNMSLCVQENNEDDLLLGASASPTTGEMSNTEPPPLLMSDEEYGLSLQAVLIDSVNYVGLVNQAMTCYLNSLLQALYMTPEFRNALYNWEFDGQNESRSIPFQLQKLFLNLQTSKKKAVETTDLTTSFGWQGSDAWQQHDIQELCRVMFDALEQKFKDTKQSNLINDLYEGKMLDYVKCLECGTEKSREDTFLDIPLPVRPFGSNVAYNSVEEALRAFVQPETLDGNNQYHCEKCNKKCDAHKGLKFTNFPYLLTLHLKRFDFDYSTLHRIKLNDKVVFSEALNLNSFIQNNRLDGDQMEEREHIVRCDDCSTTDSGSALDDEGCQTSELTSNLATQDVNCEDSDEGIDVSSGNNHETEAKGPYVYDLFSIMIHSGSATGGHYYAYIKDFEKQQWFCFNDQSVSRITEDDIRKTYGGGPQRSYYSGAYSSSTNAYMLMYRQIDAERNCKAITVEEFPTHIKNLLLHMQRKEEQDRLIREKENELIKISVFCYHPIDNKLIDANVSVFIDTTLAEAAAYAYTNPKFKLDGVVAKEDCRIVKYNKHQQCIDSSFDTDTIKFCDIASQVRIIHSDYWMLEIRSPGTDWQTYKPGGINLKVFPISFELEELDETTSVRININETVGDLSNRLAPLLNMEKSSLKIVMENYNNELKYFDNEEEIVRFDPKSLEYRLYVSNTLDEDQDKSFQNSRLKKIIHKFRHVFSFVVILPDTNIATLETLSIPSLDLNQNLDKLELAAGDRISPNLRASPQPGPGGICCDGFGDQSNSEDSSLSDSDRTLVGDAPGEGMGLSSNSSNSPADQHMASPTDPTEDAYNYEVLGNPSEEMHWDDEETQEIPRFDTNYFKVTSILSCEGNDPLTETTYSKYCRVLADKRMTLERLKKHLEPYIKVPVEYFKIFKKYPSSEEELSTDSFGLLRDDSQLVIKLGRVLRKDEYSCKIHLLRPESSDPFYFLFEHVVAKGQTVGRILKEVIIQAKKQHMLDLTYSKCRLREKNWKKPRKVYLENQIFGEEIVLTRNFEMFLQKLSDNERVTSTSQMVVFVRHWRPSALTLDKMQEVVLTTPLLEELKSCISEMANIPLENLEIASAKTSIPADVHVLEIQSELDWKPCVTNIEEWPLQASDGSVFFYRDDREQLKELTTEERKEINFQENKRLGKLNSIKTYSPGKERALKIYLDTSPCKTDDNCTD